MILPQKYSSQGVKDINQTTSYQIAKKKKKKYTHWGGGNFKNKLSEKEISKTFVKALYANSTSLHIIHLY